MKPDARLPPSAGLDPRPAAKPAPPATKPGPAPGSPTQSTRAAKPKPAAAPPPTPERLTVDGLLRQPRSAYTLQLAGLRDRGAGERFIQRHGLAGKAVLLATRRDGQAWYVLLYGRFASRQAALAAADRLPPAVRREVKPWVRTVGEIAGLPR